jgi:cardiolipin synthase
MGRLDELRRRRRPRGQPPLTAGHRVEVLTDGGDFFGALEPAIAAARTYAFLETYILASDETGWRVARTLAETAKRGVEVCVLYDGFGSLELDPYFAQYLENAGVKTCVYRPLTALGKASPWSRRNHRKSVVIDGGIGIVGGMNIAAEYDAPERGGAHWRDTSVWVEGPAVGDLEASFRRIWEESQGSSIRSSPRRSPPLEGGEVRARFTHNFLRKERAEIRAVYLEAVRGAQRSIRICNAYFVPHRKFRAALRAAAKRGVQVEIITAGNTDVALARLASRSYYPKLLKAGIRIFEWHERVLHAKTAVVDGGWSTIGSANLDYFSSFMNLEVNAVLESKRIGEEMEKQFLADRSRSTEITLQTWKTRPWYQRLFDWLFHQLARGY